MVTLVTGATGFLGKYLISHLRKIDPNEIIYGCALNAETSDNLKIESINLTDAEAVTVFIQKIKPTRVYHLAGIARVTKEIPFESYFLQNTIATQILLKALVSLNSPLDFFLTSSVHVYGNQTDIVTEKSELKPNGVYGFTKYLAEETLKTFIHQYPNLRGVVGRLYTCIGPNQALGFVASDICKKIKELQANAANILEVGPIDSFRRFTDARDMVTIFPLLLKASLDSRFEVFNIASPNNIQIGEMIQTLLDLAKVSATIVSTPSENNTFKGLNVDTSKMAEIIPASSFRPFESTLQDILASTV